MMCDLPREERVGAKTQEAERDGQNIGRIAQTTVPYNGDPSTILRGAENTQA